MFTTMKGVSLQVWMGKTLPKPPPPLVLDALGTCEVMSDALLGGAFRLSFSVDAKRFSQYGPLADSARDPFWRVSIAVLFGLDRQPLIEGVVTEHRYLPSSDGERATVTLTGKDLSVLLDLEERRQSYENESDSDIVKKILRRYSQHRLDDKVRTTSSQPDSKWYQPLQQETDLMFLRRLARRNGYIFAIEPQASGGSTAYFGPLVTDGEPPQKQLSLGPGESAVRSLNIRHDALAPVEWSGATLDPKNGQLIAVQPPPDTGRLADNPTTVRRKQWLGELAHLPEQVAKLRAKAAQAASEPSLLGEGELDGLVYRKVLRARRRVEVQGISDAHDGTYMVRSVTHQLAPGSYEQRFKLTRDGTTQRRG